MTIAEFPTTREAAQASREAGLAVLVGAPNLVLGGSHSGNIAAIDLLRDGQADILSSDYVPASLMESVFKLRPPSVGISPARGGPAGLAQSGARRGARRSRRDRAGRRADLVRVRQLDGAPRGSRRVARGRARRLTDCRHGRRWSTSWARRARARIPCSTARGRCCSIDAPIAFAHRYITRPADAGGENHVALSRAEFALRRAHGLFAFHWQAHGNDYGIGREIQAWRAAGLTVVVSGSREHSRRWRHRPGHRTRADHRVRRQAQGAAVEARPRDAAAAAERLGAARPTM